MSDTTTTRPAGDRIPSGVMIEAIRKAMLQQAVREATDALVKLDLSKSRAHRFAHVALEAGSPSLRKEHSIHLAGVDTAHVVGATGLALTNCVLNAAVFSVAVARGGPKLRRAALAGAVGHVALFALSQYMQVRTRKRANNRLNDAANAAATKTAGL